MFRSRPYLTFCRIAAVAFFAVSLYTVVIKVPSAEFADDWTHTVLHVVTGALAIILGWVVPDGGAARLFTWAVVVVYGILGVVGWFVPGVAMGTPFRIPLGVADNIFHDALALTGLGFLLATTGSATATSATTLS